MKKICFLSLVFPVLLFVSNAEAGSIKRSMETSVSALKAQSKRMEIIAQNIANYETTGLTANADPYRRKVIFFENRKDPKTGANILSVRRIAQDDADFKLMYQPSHPAANEEGYVKYPNVDRTLESLDLKEAQRSYEANISAIETGKAMIERTLELMR
jgi:flagellar basal-body rod protein FlgC